MPYVPTPNHIISPGSAKAMVLFSVLGSQTGDLVEGCKLLLVTSVNSNVSLVGI